MARRKRKIERRLGTFLRQYGRKTKNTPDPNDLQYDRELEKQIKRMKPKALNRLMRVSHLRFEGEQGTAAVVVFEAGHVGGRDAGGVDAH